MKKINFQLVRPVRLVPLGGVSDVTVYTTGDVSVQTCESSEPREKSITLVKTQKASLTRSPMGLFRTVKIRLPLNKASESEFHDQLTMLFDILRVKYV